jgi:hypothetical protein
MMALDPYNNLNKKELDGINEFVQKCKEHNVKEINFTGSNTDPLMYLYQKDLITFLRTKIENIKIGLRTNGVLILKNPELWNLYDKASISITSFNLEIYKKTMGQGTPPNLEEIIKLKPEMPLKINVVLCPENLENNNRDLLETILRVSDLGIKNINLREPYGQPHIGDPLKKIGWVPYETTLGMPTYFLAKHLPTKIVYWDVHYVEVESVNLYANGVVSLTYPVTKGHDPINGIVKDQNNFIKSGRIQKQWLNSKEKVHLGQI